MPRTLPIAPSLEQLKNQARDLHKAYRALEPDAVRRAQAQLPALGAAEVNSAFLLSDALFVIAREYGFPSWPKLKSSVEALVATRAVAVEAAAMASALPRRPLSPRKQFIQELGNQLLVLAGQGEIAALGRRLSIPLRDIVAVRAYLCESDGHSRLVTALLQGLEHASARVRFDCANAMDHLADVRCAAPLRRLLDDPVPRVRRAALHSLGCDRCKLAPLPGQGDRLAVVTRLAFADPSIRVRRAAAAELGGDCYNPRAVATLEALLAQESDAVILRNARAALQRQRSLAPSE